MFWKYVLNIGVDILICEVGLGGSYDSVNALPITSGIITSIGLDHMNRLGDSLEKIALAKVGISRYEKPLVIAEPQMPKLAMKLLEKEKVDVFYIGKDYGMKEMESNWLWHQQGNEIILDKNKLHPQSVSGSIMLVKQLKKRWPVSDFDIIKAMKKVDLPGRMECICASRQIWVDVAHNEPAVDNLMKKWSFPWNETAFVVQFKKDKDWHAMLDIIVRHTKNIWVINPAQSKKASSDEYEKMTEQNFVEPRKILAYAKLPESRLMDMKKNSKVFNQEGKKKLVFGSFAMVAKAKEIFQG